MITSSLTEPPKISDEVNGKLIIRKRKKNRRFRYGRHIVNAWCVVVVSIQCVVRCYSIFFYENNV